MKPVLLALAVIVACVVYEMDRDSRLEAGWHTQLEVGRVLNETLNKHGGWMPAEEESGSAVALPAPHELDAPRRGIGKVERELSIRLFGPGVSKRQQIRV